MAKGSGCFECKHHCNGRIEPPGWSYDCSLGLKNDHIMEDEDILECPKAEPMFGFYVAGYYSHAEVVSDGSCKEIYIWSDGEFPIHPDDTGVHSTSKNKPEFVLTIGSLDGLIHFAEMWKKVFEKREERRLAKEQAESN